MCGKTLPARAAAWQALGFVFVGVALFGGGALPAKAIEQMPVTVVIARQGLVTEKIPVVGTLAAREEVQVHSLFSGREIKHLLVDVGQRVEAGQPLALLDSTDTLIALDKNAVSLRRANVAIAAERSKVEIALVSEREALSRLERSRSLQPKGAVSSQVLQEHQNAYDRAVAELDLARQSLALAEADGEMIASERREIELALERSTVRAPSAGTILDRSARIGAMTSSSGEALFVIARDGAIEFVAEVTDATFGRIKEGMEVQIAVQGLDEPVRGRVRLSPARLDPKTRSGSFKVALESEARLVPGAFARGEVAAVGRSNVLVPGTAVKSAAGTSSIYVVKNDMISVRPVTLGAKQDNLVEIIEGVGDGEMIVLKAGGFLRERDRVIPVLASVGGAVSREVSGVLMPANAAEGVR